MTRAWAGLLVWLLAAGLIQQSRGVTMQATMTPEDST